MARSRFIAAAAAVAFLILTGFRVYLYSGRGAELEELTAADAFLVFLTGLRLDAVVVFGLLALLVLALNVVPRRWLGRTFVAARVWAAMVFVFLFGAELAGVYFFRYYDFRPNYLVLDHAADPEVAATILAAYPVVWIAVLTFAGGAAAYLLFEVTAARHGEDRIRSGVADRVVSFLLLALAALGMRGTLDRRPLNPSASAVTSNRLANEIAGSGIYNVVYELAQRSSDKYAGIGSILETMDVEAAVATAREHLAPTGSFTDDAPNRLVRVVGGGSEARPLNVVLIVMESFTGRLIGHLGGTPALSPRLDAIAEQGVIFENCFATGERTIQGLEAIVCSFPPLPGVGVVRRPQAQHGFATLATVLAERGYETLFVYGGQGIFDQMRGFFLENGYDRFIEEKDFEDPIFTGKWGACDEDLYARIDRECRRYHAEAKPFFVTGLTISLHSPWEYPAGRIEERPESDPIPKGFEYEELNTFLYADEAIGRYMDAARTAPYFDDTLFVFVGDHGVHLRGKGLVPVDDYRVAAVMVAPRYLEARRVARTISQIDIGPTIMGVLGGEYRSAFFGRDRLGGPGDDFALMIYSKKRYAVLNGHRLTVISERGEPLGFARGDGSSDWLRAFLSPDHGRDVRALTSLVQLAERQLMDGCYNTESKE